MALLRGGGCRFLQTLTPQHRYVFRITTLRFLYCISFTNGIARGIALGSPHNSVRLHTSAWPKPPSLRRGSPDSSKHRLEDFCATLGTFLPPTKRSSRVSTSVGPETRLFYPLLSCTKEGRWSTTHSGPALSEPLPLQREVQDVDVEDFYVPDSSGRLVCHCRPERCPILTFRSSGGTGSSFGLPLEERLTSTRLFPLAWPWF